MRGFVNINKPKDMTSSDVIVIVRGILRKATGEKQKAGHFGTLDPMGTGVLPVAIGNATRLFDYSINKVKVYETTFKFGLLTDTLDTTGKIIDRTLEIPNKEQIKSILSSFIGIQEQLPPNYSAKSINGKRAYDLARAGKQVTLDTRSIEIFSIEMIEKDYLEENEYAFRIACSGGTYIRSIARDLGARLNSLAVMSSIHRIKSGEFEINNAVTIEDFSNDPLSYILPIDIALNNYEDFVVEDKYVDKVLNGVKINFENMPNNLFKVICNNEIIGIGENDNGKLVIRTRL